jgi:hypothetical protein
MNQTPKDPRIKALASEAAGKIKALAEAHQTQIQVIYQQFREQAANLESNADELQTHSATPVQSTEIDTNENNYA